MTNGPRRAGLGRKIIAPVLAVAVLAGGVHLWADTNLFGDDDLCGGLVSADAAEAALPGAGRLSDRGLNGGSKADEAAFTCVVESSSLLPWAQDGYLRISGSRARGDFPFTSAGRTGAASVSFFSGGATGAVADGHGWVLLPEECTTADGPAVVDADAPKDSEAAPLARLLTEVANRAAERAGCAGKTPLTAPNALAAAPEPRPVGEGSVCGLDGLPFPGTPDQARTAQETVQDTDGPLWACEVTGQATFTVTREPRLLAGILASPGLRERPDVGGLKVSGFDANHVVAECGGTPTYFSMETHPGYTTAFGKPGTPKSRELHADFVRLAGERFGCTRS
ncbi:hypothetical protein [Streptomyces tagetis]|uniref:Uncharacterized protein n=1 Tax=Streptomyces tagetis TaxID=2820809 RepID=A0A940XPP3_9ACTN|nr:hypothetical protein [Streptomyces sp. RG38]MBQ0830942.1 hypothetical protein [Streptomyces sp. RG38]